MSVTPFLTQSRSTALYCCKVSWLLSPAEKQSRWFCCVRSGDKCRVWVAAPYLFRLFLLILVPLFSVPLTPVQTRFSTTGGGWVRSNCFSAGTWGQHWRPRFASSCCVSICRLNSVPVLQTIYLSWVWEHALRQAAPPILLNSYWTLNWA